MPATSRVLRAWLPVVVVAVVASLLFQLLGLPSPVLFGSLTGGMLYALTSTTELVLPQQALSR